MASNTRRLRLGEDLLSRKVSYWTDNGAYFCYYNRWRNNRNASGGQYDTPVGVTIRALRDYHRSLGLKIELYHLDR